MLSPSDPYEPPIRTPEEWICGDDLWYPERIVMYGLAKQQLQKKGRTDQQSEVAVAIAQSFNSGQIGAALGLSPQSAAYLIRDMYGNNLRHPFRAAVANHVVWTGMRQLILRSLHELSPNNASEELYIRSGRILSQRFQNRVESFRLTVREIEISCMLLNGLTKEAISKRTQLSTETIGQYMNGAYSKATCNNRVQFVHRLYGAA